MPEVDFEEGVGAPDEGGREAGEGFGEDLEVCLERFGEGEGLGVGEEVDGVHYEVLASSPAFCYCSFWMNGRVLEIECTDRINE